jgi:hypothetical protein
MSADFDLDGLVDAAVRAGLLPVRRPDCLWAGAGAGGNCSICGRRITVADVEYELEFDGVKPTTLHAHAACFDAWERRVLIPAGALPSTRRHKSGPVADVDTRKKFDAAR